MTNAVGLLKEEMRRLDSIIMRNGEAHRVPAGGAMAVDREGYAEAVTAEIESHPLIEVIRGRNHRKFLMMLLQLLLQVP